MSFTRREAGWLHSTVSPTSSLLSTVLFSILPPDLARSSHCHLLTLDRQESMSTENVDGTAAAASTMEGTHTFRLPHHCSMPSSATVASMGLPPPDFAFLRHYPPPPPRLSPDDQMPELVSTSSDNADSEQVNPNHLKTATIE
jgi:hypothetical protein